MTNELGTLLDIVGILISVITVSAMLIWVERRLIGIWQDRLGPNRVGPLGLLQVVADMIKIFFKEDWIPLMKFEVAGNGYVTPGLGRNGSISTILPRRVATLYPS